MSDEVIKFDNLGDAIDFLNKDLDNVIKGLQMYQHHVKELMVQLGLQIERQGQELPPAQLII